METTRGVRDAARHALGRTHERDFAGLRHLRNLGPPGLIVDVGANRGTSARSIWAVLPEANIVSFEPNPVHQRRLERIARSHPGYRYFVVALGERPGRLTLYWPEYRGTAFSGLASADRAAARGWLGAEEIYRFDAGHLRMREVEVEIRTLDEFAFEPELIKIDVEGLEREVVLGAWKTIEACRPILLIESVHPGDPIATLVEPLGYRLYAFDGDRFVAGRAGSPNSFLVPEEKAGRGAAWS